MLGVLQGAARVCAGLVLAVFFAAAAPPIASAAERNISLIPGVDLPGFDYQVVKNTTIKACQQACTEDNLCRAFTFNSKSKWCFLKGDSAEQQPFADATSGIVSLDPSPQDL